MRPARRPSRARFPILGTIAAALLIGSAAGAGAQTACGVPPSGLVRLWAGLGCQGQSVDVTVSSLIHDFPAYSISNGTGQWIAVSDNASPADADHTLFVQNGCYYGDLSAFHLGGGQSWVGNIRAISILPSGGTPDTFPGGGDRVIGRCH
ncbi:hypothetical protein [Acidisoma sp. 7E03]